jgi:hypothetical protein
MSCQGQSNLLTRISRRFFGISQASGKSAYLGGSPAQVSFFDPQQKRNGKSTRRSKQSTTRKTARRKQKTAKSEAMGQNGQASFFALPKAARDQSSKKQPKKEATRQQPLPTQRQIKLTNDFSTEELQTMSVQLRLGAAAASRRIRELNSGISHGIGHSDPRAMDWARADQKNFQFLVNQVAEARRDRGYINTSSLSNNALVDLWEFSKFEADRAARNIDHLQSGLSHLKGPTADYLSSGHKLETRFYSFLAGQLEPLITPAMQDDYLQG